MSENPFEAFFDHAAAELRVISEKRKRLLKVMAETRAKNPVHPSLPRAEKYLDDFNARQLGFLAEWQPSRMTGD